MGMVSKIQEMTSEYEERIYSYEHSLEWGKFLGYIDTAFRLHATRRYEGKLRASGMYYLCPRQFVWSHFFPQEESIDLVSGLRMSLGTSLHHIVQNQVLGPAQILEGQWNASDPCYTYIGLQRHPSHVFIEPRYRCEVTGIEGHSDGILHSDRIKDLAGIDSKQSGLILFELKTVGQKGFDALNTVKDIPPYYKMQAEIYQHLSGLHSTLFWFLGRESMASKFFIYEYTGEWYKTAIEKAQVVQEAIAEQRLPSMKCPRRTWCQWCKPAKTTEFRELLNVRTISISEQT